MNDKMKQGKDKYDFYGSYDADIDIARLTLNA